MLTWHEAQQDEFSLVADRVERFKRTLNGSTKVQIGQVAGTPGAKQEAPLS